MPTPATGGNPDARLGHSPRKDEIDAIMDLLYDRWINNPELRLGQLISKLLDDGMRRDVLFATDEEALRRLRSGEWSPGEMSYWDRQRDLP